jgi:hypothetical protein
MTDTGLAGDVAVDSRFFGKPLKGDQMVGAIVGLLVVIAIVLVLLKVAVAGGVVALIAVVLLILLLMGRL